MGEGGQHQHPTMVYGVFSTKKHLDVHIIARSQCPKVKTHIRLLEVMCLQKEDTIQVWPSAAGGMAATASQKSYKGYLLSSC